MKKFILPICAVVLMAISSCSEKDEGPLGNIEDKKDEQYKEVVQQANDNVASVGSLVNALNNNDIITSVTPIKEGDKEVGYTIAFANSQPISVYFENKNSAPALGVKPDNAGDFYWTLNGEWLLDDAGKKIKYDGTSSSILPKLKVENSIWMLSVDNGKTWKKIRLVSSSSQGNNKIFKDINVSDAESVTFTFVDGTKLVIPREPELTISFGEEKQISVKPNSTVTIDYTITGKIEGLKVEVVTSGNVKAEIKNGESSKSTITITAGESIDENDKVILIAQNKSVSTSKTLSFEEEKFLTITSDASYEIDSDGGTIEFNIETNADYSISIPEEAKSWISVAESRAIRQETVTLSISKNEGEIRSVTIQFVDKEKNTLALININQEEGSDFFPSNMAKAFPDENFRKYVLNNFDVDKNGIISEDEALKVSKIDVSGSIRGSGGIMSLDGIQYFQNLKDLKCGYNQLSTLDVSKNTVLTSLDCSSNKLTSLDVSKNTALTSLICGSNKLTSLDVSKNTALTSLTCSHNQLTALDVSKNTALTSLICGSNKLTSLDVSKNTELLDLDCNWNSLISLDLSGCTALSKLECPNNQGYLTTLNLSNCSALSTLNVDTEYLVTLDVSGCTSLTRLCVEAWYNERLKSLNASGCIALTYFLCRRCDYASLNLSGCTSLITVKLYNSDIAELNLSGCRALNSISFNWSGIYQNMWISNLDVTGCVSLTELDCRFITRELNVTGCTSLTTLNLTETLTTLNASGCIALSSIKFNGNDNLKILDVSGCISLTELIYPRLQLETLDVSGCISLTKLYCERNKLTSLDVTGCTALKELYCNSNQLTSLDVTGCTELTELYCDYNQLTSLDVSKNTALTKLYCGSNQLTSLDVSKNTALTGLSCYNNRLTSLDVTGCTALKELYCYDNQLSALDVSKNMSLVELNCSNNQLTTLDVSKNIYIRTLYCNMPSLKFLFLDERQSLVLKGITYDRSGRYINPETTIKYFYN
ncbi:MAG: hypothetical protein HDS83_06545 [Bacteroidales bacterium]|nr:hypothetical protein [Bacteroidales bacterium]